MIASLNGILGYRASDHAIIDVNGVGYKILISHQTAARLCNQDKVFEASGLNDCFQILDVFFQREPNVLPIGKAAPAPVIANHGMTFRQQRKPRTPDRTLPIEVEVTDPMPDPYQRSTDPARGVCDSNAVPARAESYLLYRL